jgi:hypothetical protein
MSNSEQIKQGYRVLVDDNFHYMDENYRECAGDFESYEDALALAKKITFESVIENEADTASETFQKYKDFGKDPFIQPFGDASGPEENYSAWNTAEILAQIIEVERGKAQVRDVES